MFEASIDVPLGQTQGCRKTMTGRKRVAQGLSRYERLVLSRSAISRSLYEILGKKSTVARSWGDAKGLTWPGAVRGRGVN